jgi:putative hydrolase of the HAD superfamily
MNLGARSASEGGPPRAVFFDAVGTLLHPDPPAPVVYADVARRRGSCHDAAAILSRFRTAFQNEEAIDLKQGLRTSEERERARWQRIVAAVLDDVNDPGACFDELYDHFSRPESWRVEPDAAAAVADFARRGIALGLASNYDRRLRTVLAGRAELRPLRHIVISSEVGWRKPSAELFAALCRSVELAAADILFVGDDWENDYVGGVAAGLRTVLFDPRGKFASADVPRITNMSQLV